MKENTSTKPVTAKNYSAEQEAAIIAASPLNLESATALAASMGKSAKSVIAKAKSLNLPYNSKPVAKKKPVSVTKAQLVALIEQGLELSESALAGLEKAPMSALVALIKATDKPEDATETA
jgi:hypothetical protein